MNFLSHYYFDQQETEPYYLLGIALPDLVKNFNRTWNVHPHKHEALWVADRELKIIQKGWNRHLEVDRLFHDSLYFKEKTGIIRSALQKISYEATGVKPFILAHIGLEILLDILLIRDQKVNIANFYAQLEACSPEVIARFLHKNGVTEAERFIPFYERFNTVRYLFEYKNNESLVYALNRINYRITGHYFTAKDISMLEETFDQLAGQISMDYISIFESINRDLD